MPIQCQWELSIYILCLCSRQPGRIAFICNDVTWVQKRFKIIAQVGVPRSLGFPTCCDKQIQSSHIGRGARLRLDGQFIMKVCSCNFLFFCQHTGPFKSFKSFKALEMQVVSLWWNSSPHKRIKPYQNEGGASVFHVPPRRSWKHLPRLAMLSSGFLPLDLDEPNIAYIINMYKAISLHSGVMFLHLGVTHSLAGSLRSHFNG